jgi:ABC-type multidrug transport system fused ATPase/permease subunit
MSVHEEEKLGTFDALGYTRRLMRFLDGQRGLLALCVLGSMVASGVQIVAPLLVRYAVDHYIADTRLAEAARVRGVLVLGGWFSLLLLLNLVVSYAVELGLSHIGQRVVAAIRTALWRQLHRLPISYFDANPIGRLVTRVANDTNALAELFTSVLASGVTDVAMFCGILVVMALLDVRLALVLGFVLLPLAILVVWFKTASQRLQRRIRELLARLNAFFQENVQGIAVVKSFTAEARMVERFHGLNAETYETEMKNVHLFAIFRPLVSACSTAGLALILWWGGGQVIASTLSLGTLVAFLFYVRMLFAPVDDLAEKFNILQQALVASERILRILETPVEGAEQPSARATPARARGHVVFEQVSFAYDPAKPVLQDISFEIRPGETVALVGPSGSGKTTIASLLLGFYPLAGNGSGRILLDGIPIETWEVRALRRQFALVQQELFLFSTDLRHNVTLFTERSDEVVAAALEASQSSRVVEKFEDGLAHPLNERATMLSQGERQLLSFARALVADPPVLILDEATASVDSKTEQAIQEALRRILHGRTALVVAHRLSTVQEADRILVICKGRIAEQGSHAELLARNGLYAHMFRTQQLDPRA